MPGLMALRAEFADSQPLAGARITGFLHMTIQTAVLIETLVALWGRRSAGPVAIFFQLRITPAAAVVCGPDGSPDDLPGVPVFAWKGETLEEYWWATQQILPVARGRGPQPDPRRWGDATMLVHKGAEYEAAGSVPSATEDDPEEWQVVIATLTASLTDDPQRWTRIAAGIRGVSEETTTGVHRPFTRCRRLANCGSRLST
ncbi:MAG: hypothetical protein Ct9H300mP12_05310 [Acidimicrobiales bacterium]|nr:MAG: hypothetical protein Ct9H300mP12_05310 [Acidimicrobiales bacterium]